MIQSVAAGMSPSIAMDIAILNDGMQRLGYYKSQWVSPVVINDTLTVAGAAHGSMQMPLEFWLTSDGKMTYMVCRSGASCIRSFCEEFVVFVQNHGFANVAILTATGSPVSRERNSNRQIPEVFAYCNDALLKTQPDYYKNNGIRKFGYWIEEVKKRPHQELSEMTGEGWAPRLLKAFNKTSISTVMFVIFCTGGIDFVGGFVLYNFMKQRTLFGNGTAAVTQKIGQLSLSDGIKSGEQVHELLFESKKVKVPVGWSEIMAYF